MTTHVRSSICILLNGPIFNEVERDIHICPCPSVHTSIYILISSVYIVVHEQMQRNKN